MDTRAMSNAQELTYPTIQIGSLQVFQTFLQALPYLFFQRCIDVIGLSARFVSFGSSFYDENILKISDGAGRKARAISDLTQRT